MPTSFQVRAFLAEAPLLSASAKNRCGLRVDRLRPPSALRFAPPPLLRRGLARSIATMVTNYLWQLHYSFTRHRSCVTVSGRFHFAANPQPPLAFPTCKDRHPHSGLRSAQAAIRNHPPTHKWTDERTVFSPWHSSLNAPCGA